jgi:endoglucanase
MTCNSAALGTWEKFTVINAGDWKIALQGNNGKYVNNQNGNSAMTCNSSAIGGWEAFEWIDVNGQVALKGFNGKFVCSEGGATSGMYCNRETVSGWESFSWATTTKSAAIALDVENINSDSEVSVYPNPLTNGTLNLKLSRIENNEASLVVITDMSGRVVLTKTFSTTDIQINTQGQIRSGLYNVRVVNGTQVYNSKLVVR